MILLALAVVAAAPPPPRSTLRSQRRARLGRMRMDVRRLHRWKPGVIRQPLDWLRHAVHPAVAEVDSRDHEVLQAFCDDAIRSCHLPYGFPITAVECEGDAKLLAVAVGDLRSVRTPARIAPVDGSAAVVGALLAPLAFFAEAANSVSS